MGVAFPGETPEYRKARDELLEREIELRRAVEAVAEARRHLPLGGEIPEDYRFQRADADGNPVDVRMSELFEPNKDSLAVYSYMFGPDRARPCPMCTSLLDSLNGASQHVNQRINFVVVAGSGVGRLREFAEERGWRHLRLLSTAGNNYNHDYFGVTPAGNDTSMMNVFRRTGSTIQHFWGSELFYTPPDAGQDYRAMDTVDSLWSMFDLVPEGRGTGWYPELIYP